MLLSGKIIVVVSAITVFIAFVVAAAVGNVIVSYHDALTLPAPNGPYKVGRIEFDWVDRSRADTLADGSGGKRELVVWAWYPAARVSHGQMAPYLPPAWAKAYEEVEGAGRYLEHDPGRVRTHSWAAAPVAQGDNVYPVIIMQPGMGRMPTDYTVFAEDLASHGYVVFGVNPTYSANVTVFPDGRVARRSAGGMIPANIGAKTLREDARRIGKVWQDDAVFVMDRLERLDADPASPFHARLDLTRIGLFGHSFGGATAFDVCARDARCKAGADLDGTLWNGFDGKPMRRPFLFMAEDNCRHNCETMREKYLGAQASSWYLSIGGTRHFNYSDLPLRLSPSVRILFGGFVGPIKADRALAISSVGLVAFFDETLKGDTRKSLVQAVSGYPEVRLRTRWQHARAGRFLRSAVQH